MKPNQILVSSDSDALANSRTQRQPLVLVVDDDSTYRTLATMALSKAGFEVVEAADGGSALALAQSHDFDAMVIDAKMPVMDGFETCKAICEAKGAMTPPLILSTGLNDDASINRAFDAGAVDYVTKPLNWRILVGKLKALIESFETKKAAQQSDKKITQIISASSGAHLILNHEAVIGSAEGTQSLPSQRRYPLRVGDCLFDVVPADTVPALLGAWKKMLTSGESGPVLVANHDPKDPFVLELVFVATGQGQAIAVIKDFTGTYLAEQRIYNLAYLDRTTGVGNRAHLIDWLNQFSDAADPDQNSAVVRIRVSRWQEQELRLGRSGLDALAVMMVKRLQQVADPGYIREHFSHTAQTRVSRLAEDEYAIALAGAFPTGFLNDFAARALDLLLQAYEVDATHVRFDARIGIADRFQVTANPVELLNCASVAMKLPNASQTDRIYLFNQQTRTQLKQQADLERYLRRDIEQGVLHMAYQPKVDASSLQLVGMEALLRWNCQELGNVSPGTFIPLAEACGLMSDLSALVIKKVFAQLVAWQGSSVDGIPVAINISGSHLSATDFVCDLARQLECSNISPDLIEIEVTESIMIDSASCAVANLHKLRAHGIKISVDDFGTGYSSLSYLGSLPVDVLKIDRSFVQSIHEDPKSLAIAKAIITVGHELGLKIVAEGVETKDQLLTLRELGCDIIQGFFTGRPVVARELLQEARVAQQVAA